ncbi:MAG: SseB family protein, partial [Methanobrevibacter sp.]
MNRKLKELISLPNEEASPEDDELLVEELKKAQLIMPIEVISHDDDDFNFKPVKIGDDDKNEFIALFTDEDELIKANVEFSVINISTKNLAEMIKDTGDEYYGIAINTFSKYSLA